MYWQHRLSDFGPTCSTSPTKVPNRVGSPDVRMVCRKSRATGGGVFVRYGVVPYFISKTLMEMPIVLISQTITFLTAYWIMGPPPPPWLVRSHAPPVWMHVHGVYVPERGPHKFSGCRTSLARIAPDPVKIAKVLSSPGRSWPNSG